jgi:hypothetical protein
MGFKAILLLLFCFCAFSSATAQTDTSAVRVDTVQKSTGKQKKTSKKKAQKETRAKIDTLVKDSARLALEALPRKAALSSALVPGLGQIKNKRWWKVPLVYGGFVGVGLVFEFNNRYYRDVLKEVQYRTLRRNAEPDQREGYKYSIVDEHGEYRYSTEGLTSAKDFYRRNRDLSVLAGLAFHAFQIIDAYVDAKFFRYDIGEDLSLQITPSTQTVSGSYSYMPVPALKLKLSL